MEFQLAAKSDEVASTLFTIPSGLPTDVHQVKLFKGLQLSPGTYVLTLGDQSHQVQYRSALTTTEWLNLGSSILGTPSQNCAGWSRREMLQIGCLSLLGMLFPATKHRRCRRVVLLDRR